MRHTVRIGSVLLVIALAVSVIAGCSSSGKHTSNSSTLIVPKDPGSVTVVAGKATTLDLGGGADLIIPPGAMTPSAVVYATYQGRPVGNWTNISPTSAPVELISNPPNAIHGLLTLEFPVPVDKITPGVDPAVQFGISSYDPTTNTWTPFDSTYDAARHMVVAQIPHFSWWNPFTWDFDALFARVAQDFGQLVGARAGQATCSGRPPAWVGSLADVINDADVAIRSCAQAQGNILDVEIVNNRPYGQILTYGSSVKWGWHEDGKSQSDTVRNQFMDVFMTSNELYLPPLGHASVGIFEPKAGTNSIFHIGPTKLSIGTDLFFYLLGKATDSLPNFDKSVPKFGECVSFATQAPLADWSVSGLRDDLVDVARCVEQAFTVLVATGVLDKVSISKLATLFGRIKGASLLAKGIALAGGFTWKIGDLVADWIVNHGSMLGNGFSVYAKTVSQPPQPQPPQPQPPQPQPPQPQPPQPQPPQPQPPQAVDAYSNYGPANAGHAMCRGNPGNSLSMPGGTASQTFTVTTGVSSLSSALIQIDPDSSVTAHLSVAVNGNIAATAVAAAAGDTRFQFGPINVSAGDTITLKISFTATYGKIITVYTAGNPGGTFTTSNSCPDGAPNVSTTSTGLRAVVSGMS